MESSLQQTVDDRRVGGRLFISCEEENENPNRVRIRYEITNEPFQKTWSTHPEDGPAF